MSVPLAGLATAAFFVSAEPWSFASTPVPAVVVGGVPANTVYESATATGFTVMVTVAVLDVCSGVSLSL